ncbi:HEAT repeat domain-containing protein [Opitutaceae bacterium]|nr:HEAT repeat domain-containing protein [Opitutaceae bacterium]
MTFPKPLLAGLLAALAFAHSAMAQGADGIRNIRNADVALMNNHDPASELENFELLEGYEVNLFAADPMLANPIHMAWDSRGRLWVACSWAYPQIEPGGVANDKIIILEDVDGDGQADKSTVFADGLYIPTGLELTNGGVIVGQSPDVFFLKDTDGDDVADVKELALTGFGIEDSHHSISAWRRGPDGKIYFQEGIFLNSQIETQHGVVRNFNGGVYQYNPRTQELDMFARGTGGNPWGLVFDYWGQSFQANNPRILYVEPGTGAMMERPPIRPLIVTEKQCGGDLVSGTHFPHELQGQFITCRFKSRTVVRYEFVEDGAGFSANVLPPLISSKHPNFRPVDCKVGPDGAVYVADWYNSIINHAQHDFRDPRRDHEHGRIWRITHKDRPLAPKPDLLGRSIAHLVEQLGSPETWTRHQARKELSERDPDAVLAAVERWVKALDSTRSDYEHCLVEAMWACQNVERTSEMILTKVLSADDGHARTAGARVIRDWQDALSDPVGMLAQLADDPFPRARMQALLSAGFVERPETLPAILNVLDHDRDQFIDAVLEPTLAALRPYWMPVLERGELEFSDPAHREFAEQSAGIGIDRRLIALFADPAPSADEIAQVGEMFVKTPSAPLLRIVVNGVARGTVKSDAAAIGMLTALEQVSDQQGLGTPRGMAALRDRLNDSNDDLAAAVAANLGAWKVKVAGDDLIAILRDPNRAPAVREAAAMAAAELGSTQFVNALREVAANGDMDARYPATTALIRADVEFAKEAVRELLDDDPGAADPIALVGGFLRIRRGDGVLASVLEDMTIHPQVVARVASWHRRTGQLSERLSPFFESDAATSLSAALLQEDPAILTADVDAHGDAVRGELVFRRPAIACVSCHGIGPVGPEIGPNLVAVGGAAGTSYMVESILSPNAATAEHFENVMFTMKDDSMRMGVITYESEREITFRDSAQGGAEVTLDVADIVRRTVMPSLMPAGLADALNDRQEFLDLAKFLSALGRPGPYANDESPVLRKWRVLAKAGNTLPDDDAAWAPAYSLVNGELPASDLGAAKQVWARGFVRVQVAGAVNLAINDLTGLELWVDGEKVTDLSHPLDLATGRRTLTFAIDRTKRGQTGLRVEFVTPARSPAKLQPEGGL